MRNRFVLCLFVTLGACALDEQKSTADDTSMAEQKSVADPNLCKIDPDTGECPPRPDPVTEPQAEQLSDGEAGRQYPGSVHRIVGECGAGIPARWFCFVHVDLELLNLHFTLSCLADNHDVNGNPITPYATCQVTEFAPMPDTKATPGAICNDCAPPPQPPTPVTEAQAQAASQAALMAANPGSGQYDLFSCQGHHMTEMGHVSWWGCSAQFSIPGIGTFGANCTVDYTDDRGIIGIQCSQGVLR